MFQLADSPDRSFETCVFVYGGYESWFMAES